MTPVAEELRSRLAHLSRAERAEMAYFLIGTLDDGPDEDVEAYWDAELARRASEIKGGRAVGEAAPQVFARLRRKYV